MKKQHIIQSLMALVLVLGFTACADEDIVESNGLIVEGVPVKVQIPVSIPKMEVMESRGLSDEQERTMKDLYVIVFDKDKKREASYYFKPNNSNQWQLTESKESLEADIEHTHEEERTYGNLTLAMTSGQKYIYGFANVDDNALQKSYKKALDDVVVWDDLNKITVSFYTSEISAQSSEETTFLPQTPNIPMNGAFKADNVQSQEEGSCVITPDGKLQASGKIELRRLFAKIKFIIEKGNAVDKFILDKWQAVHLPQGSPLMESGEIDNVQYRSSLENAPEAAASDASKGRYVFEYYMLENHQDFQGTVPEGFTYAMRETKGTEGQDFLYASNNATYIRLKGTLEMKVDNVTPLQDPNETASNGVQRYANVEYLIHLGGEDQDEKNGTPDVDDFNVLRNTSYTYEITIEGVDKIVAKVRQEKDDDIPGQNGQVVDMVGSGERHDLDCHNHVFNIKITNKENVPFLFRVMTPHGEITNIINATEGDNTYNPADGEYNYPHYKDGYGKDASLLTWIQFRALRSDAGDKNLAYYDPNVKWKQQPEEGKIIPNNLDYNIVDLDTNTYGEVHNNGVNKEENNDPTDPGANDFGITPLMNLYELAEYVDRMPEDQPRLFTVFVKEYYYEKNPADKTGSGTGDWGIDNWKDFVGGANRSVVLDLNTKTLGSSSYSQGDIYITQKSIQSYYKSGIALGVEHENETGKPIYKYSWSSYDDALFGQNGWRNWYGEGGQNNYITSLEDIDRATKLTPDNGYFNQYLALLHAGFEDKRWASYLILQRLIDYQEMDGYRERNNERDDNGNIKDGTTDPINHVIPTVQQIAGWNNYESIVDCLTRNRDENGDGIIQPEEMKWYLPAINQLNEIYLGADALTTPLYKFENHQGNDYAYHYLSSDLRVFWADEGNSTSPNINRRTERIRCVRTLGTAYPTKYSVQAAYYFNDAEVEANKKPHLYTYQNNKFTFPNLDDSNFRGYLFKGELTAIDESRYDGLHTNFNEKIQMNKLYSVGFEVAKNFIHATDDKFPKEGVDGGVEYLVGGQGEIPQDMRGWTPCSEYSEATDGSDKGTWRIPNQKELSMMVEEELYKDDNGNKYGNIPSCTAWSNVNTNRTFMNQNGNYYMFLNNTNSPEKIATVRCVRDIR